MDFFSNIPGSVLLGGPVFVVGGVAGGLATYYFEDYLFGSLARRKFVAVAAGFAAGVGAAYLATRTGIVKY